MKHDLRIRILNHFKDLDQSTAETRANDWLEKQHDDLGTIRRSLIDLIELDYIRVSSIGDEDPIVWLVKHWDTKTNGPRTKDDDDKKSSKRLVESVGNYSNVEDVKLYTTVKGLTFIAENNRFRNYHVHKLLYIVIGVTVGFLLTYLLDQVL